MTELLNAFQRSSEEAFRVLSDFFSDVPNRFVQRVNEPAAPGSSSLQNESFASLIGKFYLEVKSAAAPPKTMERKFDGVLVGINASLRKFIPQ